MILFRFLYFTPRRNSKKFFSVIHPIRFPLHNGFVPVIYRSVIARVNCTYDGCVNIDWALKTLRATMQPCAAGCELLTCR
jgi:hypothetical protein